MIQTLSNIDQAVIGIQTDQCILHDNILYYINITSMLPKTA